MIIPGKPYKILSSRHKHFQLSMQLCLLCSESRSLLLATIFMLLFDSLDVLLFPLLCFSRGSSLPAGVIKVSSYGFLHKTVLLSSSPAETANWMSRTDHHHSPSRHSPSEVPPLSQEIITVSDRVMPTALLRNRRI